MEKHVIVILGCYRSGTSCVAGILNELGVDFGVCMGPGVNNPKGYFEEKRLRRALMAGFDERHCQQVASREYLLEALRRWRRHWTGNDSAVIGLKHPLLCLMGDLLENAFPNDHVSYVATDRPACDVVRSLKYCGWRWARNADLDVIVNTMITERERFLSDKAHVRVQFYKLMSDITRVAQVLSSHLGFHSGPDQLAAACRFVDPGLGRLTHNSAMEDRPKTSHPQLVTAEATATRSADLGAASLTYGPTASDNWIIESLFKVVNVAASPDLDLSKESPEIFRRFLAIARIHGLLGLVLQKLTRSSVADSHLWEQARRSWRAEIVRALRIRELANRIMRVFSSAGIRAAVLKGPDFANSLYSDPRLRPSFDLDVLVPRDQWSAAARSLENIGYFGFRRPTQLKDPRRARGEGSWISLTGPKVLIDLHWNVLNSPRWRRKASLEFDGLAWDPDTLEEHHMGITPTPATRLVIAVIHALCHHQFDRLRLLADIQRAARAITGEGRLRELHSIMLRTRTQVYLNTGLAISSQLLSDDGIETIRQTLIGYGQVSVPDRVPASLINAARMSVNDIKSGPATPARRHIRQWLHNCA